MKKITQQFARLLTVAIAAVVMLPMLSTPADARPSAPRPNPAIAKELRCSNVKTVRVYEASAKNAAVACKVTRRGATQPFLVVRYRNIRPAVTWWKTSTVASSDLWGGSEAGCFVKKGRHIIYPRGAEGAAALRWCGYVERRVGGRVIVGS
jgi:hypothetical protein